MQHDHLEIDLVLQFAGRHLRDGDAPMRELDELRSAGAGDLGRFDWESSRCEYQSRAAATCISFTNSVGDSRSAESAPSGTSNVIVGMGLGFSSIRIPRQLLGENSVIGSPARNREAPRC